MLPCLALSFTLVSQLSVAHSGVRLFHQEGMCSSRLRLHSKLSHNLMRQLGFVGYYSFAASHIVAVKWYLELKSSEGSTGLDIPDGPPSHAWHLCAPTVASSFPQQSSLASRMAL